MNNLSEEEFAVMDEIYFPVSFETILKNTKSDKVKLEMVLKNLLRKEFVHQMKYNEKLKDYERCLEADFEKMETNLYVASKKGLLAHNM